MIEILKQPWPWYVAGPIIGLMVPLLLLLLNKQLGISSSLKHACAILVPNKVGYFKYDWKKESWNLLFVLGVFGGALLVLFFFPNNEPIQLSATTVKKLNSMGISDLSGFMPTQIFSWSMLSSPVTLVMLVGGGFLVGFGTRYANGCTSGHTIMGLSQLSIGSLVATIGFFIGGLIVSWFVLPFLLSAL